MLPLQCMTPTEMSFKTFLMETPLPANIQDKYLFGYCDCLAIALHELTGYPIKAAIDGKQLMHAWVEVTPDLIIDAKGFRPFKDIVKFITMTETGRICNPTFKQLAEIGHSGNKKEIDYARKWAKVILK